jgi:PII-like signaling protein
MKKYKKCILLKIFINEKERYGKIPLHEWILKKALEDNMTVLTVVRGVEGFGTEHKVSTSKILDLSLNLPLIIEIIDKKKKIKKFVKILNEIIQEGIVATHEEATVFVYTKKK